MVKHVPHKVEDKIVNKYDTPLNEFMNCLCLMAFTLVECWRGKVPTGKNLDNFIICIQKPVLYLCFPKLLQAFRKFNEFCLSQSGLESLIQSICICLNVCRGQHNVVIPLELINLSSTYYALKTPSNSIDENSPSNRLLKSQDM